MIHWLSERECIPTLVGNNLHQLLDHIEQTDYLTKPYLTKLITGCGAIWHWCCHLKIWQLLVFSFLLKCWEMFMTLRPMKPFENPLFKSIWKWFGCFSWFLKNNYFLTYSWRGITYLLFGDKRFIFDSSSIKVPDSEFWLKNQFHDSCRILMKTCSCKLLADRGAQILLGSQHIYLSQYIIPLKLHLHALLLAAVVGNHQTFMGSTVKEERGKVLKQ